MRKTFLFMDTILNKVDAKGRVSLPADYRAIVKETGSEIVCYRSLSYPCNLVFGDAKRYPFDSTGRIMLSEKLLKHAQITDSAVFVGKGRKFQIWNPDNWAKEEQRIRAQVQKVRPSLREGTHES